MANYGVNITDNLDGTFTLTRVQRGGTITVSGGTDLTPAANVDGTTISTTTGFSKLPLHEAVLKLTAILAQDRALNPTA